VNDRFFDVLFINNVVRIFKESLSVCEILRLRHVHLLELLFQEWVFLFVNFLTDFFHFSGRVSERWLIYRLVFSIDDQLLEGL
jgi:hypothetical protein